MNDFNPQTPSAPGAPGPRRHTPSLVLGICVILFGLALTLDQLNIPHASFLVKLWPAILIALGATKLRQRDGFSTGGFILVLVGAYLLVANFSPNGLADALWPMILVGIGIYLVMKSARRVPTRNPLDGEAFVEATSIFSGCRRQPQGLGLGLRQVRQRLLGRFHEAATFDSGILEGRFQVRLRFPFQKEQP